MGIEINDLTESPPSPTRSSKAPRIINFSGVSKEKNQFKEAPTPLRVCTNPNMHHTNLSQTTFWPPSTHIYQPSQIGFSFKPNVFLNRFATVLEPAPALNTHLFPNGTKLKEPWTHREHELFLMGLIKYGKGHWSKIARDFVCNKTPQQVKSYAASFFRHLPSTHLHGFRRRKLIYPDANNLMVASSSHSMPVIVNLPQQTLSLFPEKFPYFQVPPYGEACNNFSANLYGQSQVQKSGASNSMNASANGEVDLELRLG